jgi:hypothetical protein
LSPCDCQTIAIYEYTLGGGFVGAAISAHCFSSGWIRRVDDTRTVSVTPKGQRALRESFGI